MIVQINECINILIEAVDEIVKNYQVGKERYANNLMIDFIDSTSVVLNHIINLDNGRINVKEINEHLEEMINAYKNSDSILLCDILEYEIKPLYIKWAEELL